RTSVASVPARCEGCWRIWARSWSAATATERRTRQRTDPRRPMPATDGPAAPSVGRGPTDAAPMFEGFERHGRPYQATGKNDRGADRQFETIRAVSDIYTYDGRIVARR